MAKFLQGNVQIDDEPTSDFDVSVWVNQFQCITPGSYGPTPKRFVIRGWCQPPLAYIILIDGRLPDFVTLTVVTAISLGLLLAGFRVFRRASYTFVEEL